MLNIEDFIGCRHSLLIAPAGYGKTYTIAQCLKFVIGKHLVLTHTNAGVGSILEKVKALNVPSANFQIMTISSFAQMLAIPFTKDLPKQEDKKFHKEVNKSATSLIKKTPFRRMLANSFTGLFVDEYQDCTLSQHSFIQELSEILPTHLLGDPMQGIFGFDKTDPIVDLENQEVMKNYLEHEFVLETPWRWNNQGKTALGDDLKKIRNQLSIDKTPLQDFSPYKNIVSMRFPKSQIYGASIKGGLKDTIYQLLNSSDNILFILSNSANRDARIGYVTTFSGRINLIESIDDKTFYVLSEMIDSFSTNGKSAISDIHNLLIELFSKTDIEKWVQQDRLTRKSKSSNDGKDFVNYEALGKMVDSYSANKELLYLCRILKLVPNLIHRQSNFRDVYYSLLNAIKNAYQNSSSVYDEMKQQRNITRRVGRKLYGKSIGTTLLTKGLECDTVVLLDESESPFDFKNQYVALTRGSKRVIVIQIDNNKGKNVPKQKSLEQLGQLSLWG